MRKSFASTMTEVGLSDSRLVVLVGDISHGILETFRNTFPSRYFNIGICEPAMLGVASGMSAQGLIPVVHTISPFMLERAYEQIKLDFQYQRLGVNLISVGGAFDYSKLGCSHHCYTDFSLLSHLPDSQIFFPGSSVEFEELFRSNYSNGKINYFRLSENPHKFKFLPSDIISGDPIQIIEGKDLTLIVTGSNLTEVLAAEKQLSLDGISCSIIYIHTLKPLNYEKIMEDISKTKKFMVVASISSKGGLYSQICEKVLGWQSVRGSRIEITGFIEDYGNYEDLLCQAGMDVQSIVERVKDLVNETK